MVNVNQKIEQIFDSDIFIFDVDDTLLYTFRNGFYKINAAAKECGHAQISFQQYATCYGKFSFYECITIWFPYCDVSVLSKKYDLQKDSYPYKPICDFGELQRKLHGKGIKCGILTNGNHNDKLYEKLQCVNADISGLIGVWGRENIPFPKPDARALTPVNELFPNAKIVYFGDSNNDYQMCLEGNVQFVQVLSGKEPKIQDALSIRDVSVLFEYL